MVNTHRYRNTFKLKVSVKFRYIYKLKHNTYATSVRYLNMYGSENYISHDLHTGKEIKDFEFTAAVIDFHNEFEQYVRYDY